MKASIVLVTLALCASSVNAQRAADRLRALATGDAIAVEAARRQCALAEQAELPAAELGQLLRSADPQRRAAAAWLLLHHAFPSDELDRALHAERDLAVLVPLVDVLPLDFLPRLVRAEDLVVPDDDRRLDPARLRTRALGRLFDAGRVDDALWLDALGSDDPRFARRAARLLVTESLELPARILDDAGLRDLLVGALADRPRRDAMSSISAWAAEPDASLRDRLLLTLATPRSDYRAEAVRQVFDALASEDRELRLIALRICARLSSAQADQLVSELHRRGVVGGALGELLRALDAISPRGERHLAGVARALDDAGREEIIDWLAGRNVDVVDDLVDEALDDPTTLSPALLRRAGSQLDDAARVELVRGILADPTREPAMRLAAFEALVDAARPTPELIAFALAPDADPVSRVRRLLSMPPATIDAATWQRLFRQAPAEVIGEVFAAAAAAPPELGADALLVDLAISDEALAETAAQVLLRVGREAPARALWQGLDPDRRVRLAPALRQRPPGETWLIPALRDLVARSSSPELRFTRLVVGDPRAARELLDELDDFDLTWLRRCREPMTAALMPADVPRVQAAYARAEPGRRREFLRWIAARPDLGAEDWLAEIEASDADELHLEARQGLLRRPESMRRLRARVAAAIPGGLDDELHDLAFDVLGAMSAPLDGEEAAFVARLVLVEPLATPQRELATALRQEEVGDIAVFSSLWQLLRRAPSPALGGALAAAADEASRHPNAIHASRRRLGRLLELLARDAELRLVAAPVARALIAAPDLDATMLGPAAVILAEQAERSGDDAAARIHWQAAARRLLRAPPEPLTLRSFIEDAWPARGRLPAASLAAGPHLCDARIALAAGEPAAARRALANARILGALDLATERAIERLETELR